MKPQHVKTIVNNPNKGNFYRQTIFYIEDGMMQKKTIKHNKNVNFL